MCLPSRRLLFSRRPSAASAAAILLTGSTLAENSAEGAVIGVASVSELSGPFAWSLSGVSPAGALKLSGANPAGTIAITAGPTPVDREVTMSVPFTLSANDGGKTVTLTGTISVTDANEATPVITSNGGGATASISVSENTTAVTTVTATDADATSVLTYSVAGGADAALFQINATTGVLSFISAPNYEAPADANGDNAYVVVVQVSDGVHSASQTLTVTVGNAVEVPVISAAAIVGTASVGAVLSLSVSANDMSSGSYAYAWRADGSAIAGATAATYTLTSAEVGKTITCAVTPTNAAGTGASVVTAGAGPVADASSFPTAAFTAAGGFMVLDAEDNHGEAAIIQSFAPGDVDTSANTIALAHRGFGPYTLVTVAKATRGWFGTTGTLPAISGGTLVPGSAGNPGTIVYRVDDGAGHATFYREASDADHALFPSSVEGELISIAQRYAEAIDPIDFLDGGAGTHTFYTWPVTNTLTTKTSGYTVLARDMTDPNTWFEIVTVAGKRYLFNDRSTSDPSWGAYRRFGKPPTWNDAALSVAGANKRWLWQLACVNLPTEADRSVPKVYVVAGAGVDATDDVINKTHPFATGDTIRLKVKPDSTLPGGLAASTTYYARSISSTSFSLHPTAADATANSNKIDITSAGGTFAIYALGRTGDVMQHRMRFVSEYNDMSGATGTNALTARAMAEAAQYAATAVSASGSTAGQITGNPHYIDGERVRFWLPPGSTGPTRVDTGLPLAAGLYWATLTPGGSSFRLHDTLQSAIESQGLSTITSSCIKFSAQGSGQFSVFFEDTFNGRLSVIGDREVQASKRIPNNYDVVWSSGVDMNKPGESYFRVYHGVNGAVVEDDLVTDLPVQNTGAYQAGIKPGTFMNSGAGHVCMNGYLASLCWFAGTGDPDQANLQTVMDWMATRNATRINPSNTSLPTISTDPVPGTQIVGQVGSWSGPRPWSFAFQWQRADDAAGTNAIDIAGAATIRYTPAMADIDKHLRLKISVTNRSGTTSAYSAWSNAVENDVGEAETAAFIARLSATPVTGFRTALKTFYATLINNGLLATQDSIKCRFLYGVPTTGGGALTVADALLNLAGTNADAVTGSIVWTAKTGAETTDGTGYLDSGLDPSSGALKFQRNSASIWCLLTSSPNGNTYHMIGNTNGRVNLNPRISSGAATLLLNGTSNTVTSAVQSVWSGFWCGLRRSSSAVDFIHDDVTLAADAAQPSQTVSAGTLRAMRGSGSTSKNGVVAAGGFGAGLTIAQAQTLRAAVVAFQTAVAAL
jgi:hypothetical protein